MKGTEKVNTIPCPPFTFTNVWISGLQTKTMTCIELYNVLRGKGGSQFWTVLIILQLINDLKKHNNAFKFFEHVSMFETSKHVPKTEKHCCVF